MCAETFADTSTMPTFVTPECSHAFHQWCVLRIFESHSPCPVCRANVDWHSIPCFNCARHVAGKGSGSSSGPPTARQPWTPSLSSLPPQSDGREAPPLPPPAAAPTSSAAAASTTTPADWLAAGVEDFGPGPGGRPQPGGEIQSARFSSSDTQEPTAARNPARDRRTIPEDEREPDRPPQRRKGGDPPHGPHSQWRQGSKGAKGSGKGDGQHGRRQWSSDSWSGGARKQGRWQGN